MKGKLKRYFALALVWMMIIPTMAVGEGTDVEPVPDQQYIESAQDIVEDYVAEQTGVVLGAAPANAVTEGNGATALDTGEPANDTAAESIEQENAVATVGAGEETTSEEAVDASTSDVSIKLSEKQLFMIVGDKPFQLEATVQSASTDKVGVEWLSADTKVAKVDDTGKVTAVGKGETTIIAKATDGSAVRATCKVKVAKGTSEIGRIVFGDSDVVVAVDETKTLKVSVLPKGVKNGALDWTSSNKKVATVSEGKVKGLKAGTVTITATAADGNGVYAKCKVTVVKNDKKVHRIDLNNTAIELGIGKKKTLKATALPETAKNREISWKSSKKSVAKVSPKGVVTAVKPGTAKITATAKDGSGVKAVCTVKVVDDTWVQKITLSQKSLTLTIGDKKTLKATIKPATALDKSLKWSSSNPDVVQVSSKGVVTAVGESGEEAVTITALAGDGSGIKAECKVKTVNTKPEVTDVTLDRRTYKGTEGKTYTLKATVVPEGATSKLTWSSSNKSVATVSKKGKVSFKSAGKATITVETENGKTASCEFEVESTDKKPLAKSVTLNKTSHTVKLGQDAMSFTLKATVSPEGADDQMIWTSSNPEIVKVDKKTGEVTVTGVLTQSGETADITAKVVNAPEGETIEAKCTVIVENPNPVATALTLNYRRISIANNSDEFKHGIKLTAVVSPAGADGTVTWKSSNDKVATIDDDGMITFKGKGTATVTAATDDGLKTTCDIEVTPDVVDTVNVNPGNISVKPGQTLTYQLKATFGPSGLSDAVVWESKDPDVATVSESGKVTIVNAGTTVITATTTNGVQGSCTVEVEPEEDPDQKLTLKIDDKATTRKNVVLGSGVTTFNIAADADLREAESKEIEWESSNPDIASVKPIDDVKNMAKVMIGGIEGYAIITAMTPNGLKAECAVIVEKPKAQSITLNKSELEFTLGTNNTNALLKATVKPSGADQEVTWKSGDESVVTVTPDGGVVVAVGEGTTNIVARASNGIETTCKVTVNNSYAEVTRVALNRNTYRVTLDELSKDASKVTLKLNAILSPNEVGTNGKLTWSSSNTKVATVKKTSATQAEVSIQRVIGSTVITAEAPNGKKAVCTVEVSNPPSPTEDIALSKSNITVQYGKSEMEYDLKATLKPLGAVDELRWSSSDEDVAIVDQKGHVVIRGLGEATITAKVIDEDGNVKTRSVKDKDGNDKEEEIKTSCTIKVSNPLPEVTRVTLNKSSISVTSDKKGTTYALKATISPKGANTKVTWKSSNTKVATVDANGVVTIVGVGTAKITAKAVNGEKATCTIKVVDK